MKLNFKILTWIFVIFMLCYVTFAEVSFIDNVHSGYHFTTPPDTAAVIVDAIGNQNMTNNGLDATTDKDGTSNQARDNVESNNDYLNTTIQMITNADWTVSMWVNMDSGDANGNFFCQRRGVDACAYFSGSDLYLDGIGTASSARFNGDIVKDNNWRHYVFTFASSGSVHKFYINATEMTQDATASITGIDNLDMLVMKGMGGATSYIVDGKVDEVLFINKTLNQTEITELYNTYDGWDVPANATPVTSSLDIVFRNLTNATKTIFGEDEHIRVFLNHSLSNSTQLDSECNVSAELALYEFSDDDEYFTLCGSGCNYTTRTQTANFSGINLLGHTGTNDTMHFQVCHEQNPQGDINLSWNCVSGDYWRVIAEDEIPLCSAGSLTVFEEDSTCSGDVSVNYSVSYDGINIRRKNISFFSFDREFQVLKYRAEKFGDGFNYNDTFIEYYKHGSKTINASCYYDASFNNVTSESITIVNSPPVIIHSGILIGTTVYNITNQSLVQYGEGFWNFLATIADDDIVNANHTLYCANGSVLWTEQHAGFEDSHGIWYNNFTDFECNPFVFTSFALDSNNNLTKLSNNFNVTDTIAPYSIGLVNATVFEDTTYSTSITLVDSNIFSWNYTCSDGTSDGETGLNQANKTVSFSISPGTSTVTCSWEYCDGHTNVKLSKDWDVFISGQTIYFRIDEFTQHTLEFDVTDINLSFEKKRDRVEFTLTDISGVKERDYILYYTASENSYYLRDDLYKAWIVDADSRTWFDLNGLKEEPNVFYNGNGTWEIRFHSKDDIIKFKSIGELNCVSENQVISTTPFFSFLGIFEFGSSCPDNTVEDAIFNFFIVAMLFGFIVLNFLIIKFPVFDLFVGLAFIIYGLFLLGCSGIIGVSAMAFGIILCFYAVWV